MATPKNTQAAEDLGAALTQLHEAEGRPSFRSMERALLVRMPESAVPSDTQIGNMHAGKVDPNGVTIEHLDAMMTYYQCGPAQELVDILPSAW